MNNNIIDSRQLRAFVTLARTGSFTHTGKELFLSQSAISHGIKALETDIGCRLLDRVGKKVSLTPSGEQLLHYAEKILREMDNARTSIDQLTKWGHGRLRLGASTTACQYLLPQVLGRFKERFPQCQISIHPGDTPVAMELLLQNTIDLALALEPHNEPRLEFLPLFTDELVFLVARSHPWATRGAVVREEIPQQNYILYNKGTYTFRLVQEYFQHEHVTLNSLIEVGSMETSKELVKLGLGVSILAPWIAQREIREGTLVSLPLGRRKLKRNWGILHRKARPLNLSEETFIKLCRTTTEELLATNSLGLELGKPIAPQPAPVSPSRTSRAEAAVALC